MSLAKKTIKIIRQIILFLLGFIMFLEILAVPGILWFNHNYPGVIIMKKYILWNLFAMFITYIIGVIFYELTHSKKEKDENKNR